jgi:hypothetical protein
VLFAITLPSLESRDLSRPLGGVSGDHVELRDHGHRGRCPTSVAADTALASARPAQLKAVTLGADGEFACGIWALGSSVSALEGLRTSTRVRLSLVLLGLSGVVVVLLFVASLGCRFPSDGTARVVRTAALSWQATTGRLDLCPTYGSLIEVRLLDPEQTEPSAVQIRCRGAEVTVVWAGADGRFGTVDDRTAPDPLQGPGIASTAFEWPAALLPIGSLLVTGLAVATTLLGWKPAAFLRRCASLGGVLVIVVFAGLGFAETTIAHVAATRPDLSLADSTRSRDRGTRSLVVALTFAGLVGVPGVVLAPLRPRPRSRRQAT